MPPVGKSSARRAAAQRGQPAPICAAATSLGSKAQVDGRDLPSATARAHALGWPCLIDVESTRPLLGQGASRTHADCLDRFVERRDDRRVEL